MQYCSFQFLVRFSS